MKTKSIIAAILFTTNIIAQTKPSIAVLNIDSKGIVNNSEEMGYLVRLELEKTGVYTVLDKYEVKEITAANKIDLSNCFSKTCLIETGKLLKVEKMLSGSVERFGEKIVISLRLIEVESGKVEKTESTEYLNLPEVQKMVAISVKKLVGQEPDPNMVKLLVDYDIPIESPKNTLKLNGPRMGFSYTLEEAGKILTNPDESKGGFNMFPVTFQFGWQQEFQYISAGNFQALVENIFLIGGLESGKFIPSYTPLLGFRFGKGNGAWEFGFGPTFRLVKRAKGFYDDNLIMSTDENKRGDWYINDEFANRDTSTFKIYPHYSRPKEYNEVKRLDSRGNIEIDAGLVIAVGRTFHSGYLNIPVNIYVAPRKSGTTVGMTLGFNIQKKKKYQ
jgi:TolB-like protein